MHSLSTTPILLVDDDSELNRLVAKFLVANGYRVETETDGQRALKRIPLEQPLLVILDVMLPGVDGLAICRSVRLDYSGPILMLTALGDDIDEVAGLETGADDYLAKPVRPRVMLARIRALLRRGTVESAGHRNALGEATAAVVVRKSSEPVRTIKVYDLELTAESRSATMRGESVRLTGAEFDLLWLLGRHAGQVLSRDTIYRHMRGLTHNGQDRTIDLRISKLRKKLGDDPKDPALIKSVRGVGYILMR